MGQGNSSLHQGLFALLL